VSHKKLWEGTRTKGITGKYTIDKTRRLEARRENENVSVTFVTVILTLYTGFWGLTPNTPFMAFSIHLLQDDLLQKYDEHADGQATPIKLFKVQVQLYGQKISDFLMDAHMDNFSLPI